MHEVTDGPSEVTASPDVVALSVTTGAGPLAELRAVNEALLLAGLREHERAEETRHLADDLAHRALYDGLTALPNRALLHDRLQAAVRAAHRAGGALALLYLDLDGFKGVNDRLGHHAGDLLLQQVAARLRGVLRASDTAARLGGDEFVVLLPGDDAAGAEASARRLLDALASPCLLHGVPQRVMASLGIAVYPADGTDAEALLRRADGAMYRAKRAGIAVAGAEARDRGPNPASADAPVPMAAAGDAGGPDGRRSNELRAANAHLVVAGLREQALAEQLRHQLAFTVAITAHLDEGVCALDGAGRITLANPAAGRLLGRIEADLLGREFHALVHPQCDDDCPLAVALRAGAAASDDEAAFARAEGAMRPVAYSVAPIVVAGRPAGAALAFRDVTARRRAEARQRLLAAAGAALVGSLDAEAILTAVARLAVPELADWCCVDVRDDDGRVRRLAVVHAAPADTALAGELGRFPAQPGEAPDPSAMALADGRAIFLPALTAEAVRAMGRAGAHRHPLTALAPHSLIAVPLVTDGQPLGAFTFLTTAVSGRRFTVADLALAEDLAGRCTLALANAHLYRQAREATLLRERFVATAAHELRTPLTVLSGYADLLARALAGPAPDGARLARYAGELIAGIGRLETLSTALLDTARLDRGGRALRLAPCDLVALGQEVLTRFATVAAVAPEHTLALDAPEPVAGRWDRDRLDQVLTNLVANALKYSPAGGPVRLGVHRDARGWAVVTVADAGLGIAASAQDGLFQPFARAAGTGDIAGTGLGLFLVRQIAEEHGGHVALASALRVGTTVTITLPPAPPAHAEDAPPQQR